MWATVDLHVLQAGSANTLRIIGTGAGGGSIGFLLPKSAQPIAVSSPTSSKKAGKKAAKKAATKTPATMAATLDGIVLRQPTNQMIKALNDSLPNEADKLDLTRFYTLDKEAKGGGSLSGIKIPKAGLRAAVLLTAPAKDNSFDTFSVVQEEDGKMVGGGTYVLRAAKQ
jgi:hypothetical protein